MINMMYLVLTALLALNVSKEILDSFVTVNNGLENTKLSLKDKMDASTRASRMAKENAGQVRRGMERGPEDQNAGAS
jgi:hypothetical protein